jgi:hypothetical protein
VTFNGASADVQRTTTNSAGIAKLPKWILSTIAGENVVTASVGARTSVTFHAVGRAGPAHQIIKYAGDGQVVIAGSEVPIPPAVRVTDNYGNGVSGITVTFAIESGNGNLTGSTATSDVLGIARVGSWQTGIVSNQILSAQADGLGAVWFKATVSVIELPPCTLSRNLAVGQIFQSELTSTSCIDSEERHYAAIILEFPGSTERTFKLASADFDTYLMLKGPTGEMIAANDNASASTTNSELVALLPPGGVTLVAAAKTSQGLGKFSTYFQFEPPANMSCKTVFVAREVSATRDYQPSNCDGPGDFYRIFLRKGSTLNVMLQDRWYTNWSMTLYDSVNQPIAVTNQPPINYYNYPLMYIAPADGFYTIKVESEDLGSQYIISFK